MASLQELRGSIASVQATRKITSAMKMVAAAKLRRAQEQAEAARPYAQLMERMLASLGASVEGSPGAPALIAGTGSDQTHLIVVATADRGLCGGFQRQYRSPRAHFGAGTHKRRQERKAVDRGPQRPRPDAP